MKRDASALPLLLSWLFLVTGCTTTQKGQSQTSDEGQREPFSFRVVATGLSQPFEVTWGPDSQLWVTERTGKKVTRVRPSDGERTTAVSIAEVHQTDNSQDGLLGLALHPELLKGTGNDYVYVAYTYDADPSLEGLDRRAKIRRYTYDPGSQTLGSPVDLLTGMPASTDHDSGRLVMGPDRRLYYSIGDQGHNQFANACKPIRAQELPSAEEVRARDWTKYQGKVLRLELDGSIPSDNPTLAGAQSHIYSYGHRNVQGIVFGPHGRLYASEHGPKTDDELNLLEAGGNYGWPHVSGFQDDQAYVYGNWSASAGAACQPSTFSDLALPASVPQQKESAWRHPDFRPPMKTFFTVPNGHNFQDPTCAENGLYYLCWPTVAPSSIDFHAAEREGVPGWGDSLLMPALKDGTVYRIQLSADGRAVSGEATALFRTTNRYRDMAISPDQRTFYVSTDSAGLTKDRSGRPTATLENPGAILEFRYTGTGSGGK